jgi:hypothetical protein
MKMKKKNTTQFQNPLDSLAQFVLFSLLVF